MTKKRNNASSKRSPSPSPSSSTRKPIASSSPNRGSSSSGSSNHRSSNNSGPTSPQGCSDGIVRAQSPGGRFYSQLSPSGPRKDQGRREAAGYRNPPHSHSSALTIFAKNATTPEPVSAQSYREKKKHYLSDDRHFQTQSPGGTQTTPIKGHSQGVLGHATSAAEHWNRKGHQQSRSQNQIYNRQPSTYHGIENRHRSDASGSRTPRYLSPGPHRGSDPSHWNRQDSNFQGGPWHSYKLDTNYNPQQNLRGQQQTNQNPQRQTYQRARGGQPQGGQQR